jgi:hypothetical protein
MFTALLPERPVHDVRHAIIRSDRCRSGCCRQRRNLAFGAAGNKGSGHRPLSSTGETRLTRLAVGEGVEYLPLALRSNEIWREIESTRPTKLSSSSERRLPLYERPWCALCDR